MMYEVCSLRRMTNDIPDLSDAYVVVQLSCLF
jgi:hypothetical protein